MSQGEDLRLGFCQNNHCPSKDKRVELAEYKVGSQIIGLCAKCCLEGAHRISDDEKAREKQDQAEGVRRSQA